MNKFWINAVVIECNENIIAKCLDGSYQDEVIFHTNNKYKLKNGDLIKILCDDVMTLSIPPHRKAYEVILIKEEIKYDF